MLLEVRNLKKYFPIKKGFLKRSTSFLKAVDDVSFTLEKGKTLGIVGESGCGKSTMGRAILRLHEPTSGAILFEGQDIIQLNRRELTDLRKNFQIIFQDPYASLNPRFTVREIILEPLEVHKIGDAAAREKKLFELLDVVGLRKAVVNRYPHEFSGGQRQRVGIARALALNPKLIVADEPVSALDVSVQSQVLNLIKDLQKEFGISFLFIAHDLAVVQHISHEVAVMYLGKIVEKTDAETLYANPLHPYTKALLSAIPNPDPLKKSQRQILKGDVPSPLNPPSGCSFHTRCPFVKDICKVKTPGLKSDKNTNREHLVACHLYS